MSLIFSLLPLLPPSIDEFMVSPVEGELRVRKDVELDRETTAFYNITVTARDLGTPSRNSSVSLFFYLILFFYTRKQARMWALDSQHKKQDLSSFTSALMFCTTRQHGVFFVMSVTPILSYPIL